LLQSRRPVDPGILALSDEERVRLARLVLALRSRGVDDRAVLTAIEQVPRKLFVAAEDQPRALIDRPLPIECGQMTSAPSVVGVMLSRLGLKRDSKVLEVGTGSGYAAAVMGKVVGRVYAIERYRTLVELAEERFAALRLDNVAVRAGDGLLGLPEHGPYDRILVNGAVAEVPPALLSQLKFGGVMVLPIGPPGAVQSLVRVTKTDRDPILETLRDVRFTALVPGRAAVL
jgi:protein-L-isoaspartate(D-aspartate) O-methyltransferase